MRMLDLFSGIGGFHKGFEQAGYEFDWVGFSEIDKYASAVYRHRFPEAVELGDITAIQPGDLPKIDLITFGSPCQDFSIAGKRAGAKEGTRSSLIWQAIRLIAECKPRFFVWENVKGTFSSNSGADFWAIIQAFTNIGRYRLEWQLINTRWFLPQNRERIYLVGYIGDRSGSKVFPIGEDGGTYNVNQTRTKSKTELCTAITTREGGRKENNFVIVDKQMQKKNNQYYAANLSGGNHSDMDLIKLKQIGTIGKDSEATRVYDPDGIARTIKNGGGMGAKTGLYQTNSSIRRLTPVECCRLQGFPDDWNEYGEFDGEVKPMSDTQRYKQAGNAVTVNVVQAVAERLKINIRMRQNA